MKRWLCILLACMLLPLAAVAETITLSPGRPQVLTLWHYYNGVQQQTFDRLVLEFNETVGMERGIVIVPVSQGSVNGLTDRLMAAARRDTVGSTLYLVGRNAQTGELLHEATSCAMCRRLVINAGIEKVIIRNTETEFSVVDVEDWVNLEDDVPALQ